MNGKEKTHIHLLRKYIDREKDGVRIAAIVDDEMTTEDLKKVSMLPSYSLESTGVP